MFSVQTTIQSDNMGLSETRPSESIIKSKPNRSCQNTKPKKNIPKGIEADEAFHLIMHITPLPKSNLMTINL